jgi:hypothetical protein
MAHIIYPSWTPRQEAAGAPAAKLKGFMKHLLNELKLGWLAANSKKFERRRQAEAELAIARRKREWHEKKLTCDLTLAVRAVRAEFNRWVAVVTTYPCR